MPLANGHPPVALHHGGAVFYSVDKPSALLGGAQPANRMSVNWRSRTRFVNEVC